MDRFKIVNLYQSGLTTREIGKIIGRCHKSVLKVLKSEGIERRRQFRKYTLDESYFDKIDTPEKAYWLGFLLADGSIGYNGRARRGLVLRIALQYRDEPHLRKLAKALQFNGPIKITWPHGHKTGWLIIVSVTLCSSLISHGWHNFKKNGDTSILSNVAHTDSLVRGLFDGDGCLYISKLRASFSFYSNHLSVVEWMMMLLRTKLGLRQVKIRHPAAYVLTYNGNLQTPKIMEFIYFNATYKTALDRKWAKALLLIEQTSRN